MDAIVDGVIRLDPSALPPKALELLWRGLSFPNPEYLNRVRFGRWAGATPEEITLLERGDDGEVRLPRGAVKVLRQALAAAGRTVSFVDHRVTREPVDYAFAFTLRDYQERGVQALVRGVQGCVVIPCGGGKSLLVTATIARLRQPAIVLVHTGDLADQWRGVLRDALGLEAGLVAAGKVDPDVVTVAMVQTLVAMEPAALSELGQRFGTVVVDECLPATSRVLVKGRGFVPIKECVEDDNDLEVMSYSHSKQQPEYRRVTARSRKIVRRRFVTLHIQIRRRVLTLRLTEEHPVYVEGRGYIPAIDVRESDNILALRGYHPCPECDRAFEHHGGLGGHVGTVHRGGNERIKKMLEPGGFCPYCGKLCATQGALRTHIHRHEDPEWAAALKKANSERMRATNLRQASAHSERMRRQNPMWDPVTREKMRRSHWVRSKESYKHLNGGNGTGPTVPEKLLHERLGPGWTWQFIIRTRAPRGQGLPTHYKIDLANEDLRIAVEVDGHSHRTTLGKERDARKDAWLAKQGWVCLRFRNEEVLKDPDAVVASVQEVVRCRK